MFLIFIFPLLAHFQMVLPNKDIVEKREESQLSLTLLFCHPFEQEILNMERPQTFGVLIGGEEKVDLTNTLKEEKKEGKSIWKTNYQLTKPGDYLFYVEPKPYFEPAEERYILHYAKVIVNGFGLENAWDKEVGMKVEIIPLTRPLWIIRRKCFSRESFNEW
jgi:cobalt/nickel transport protein